MSQKDKAISDLPWKEIFSFLGVVLVAYMGYLGIRSQIQIPIQATQTAEEKLISATQTSTPPGPIELPTVTASKTSTPSITPTLNTGINKYFENSCIESEYWTPYIQNEVLYPSYKDCLELLDFGLYAQNNKLLFSVNNTKAYLTKGIYTNVTRNSDISFAVLINTPIKYSSNFSYIGFGIGDANTDPVKGSFIYFRVDEPPSTTIETGDWWGTYKNEVIQKYFFNKEYQIIFSIGDVDFSVFIDNKLAGRYNLNPKQNYFWISYRVPKDGEILATISNFTVMSR